MRSALSARRLAAGGVVAVLAILLGVSYPEDKKKNEDARAAADKDVAPSSYSPVVITERFESIRKRMEGDKPKIMQRQKDLLEKRYELADRPAKDVKMGRKKQAQEGVRV